MTDTDKPITSEGSEFLYALRLTFNLHGKEWTETENRYWTARIRRLERAAGWSAIQSDSKRRAFLKEVSALEEKHGVRVRSIDLETACAPEG